MFLLKLTAIIFESYLFDSFRKLNPQERLFFIFYCLCYLKGTETLNRDLRFYFTQETCIKITMWEIEN